MKHVGWYSLRTIVAFSGFVISAIAAYGLLHEVIYWYVLDVLDASHASFGTCPNPTEYRPTVDDLKAILIKHETWLQTGADRSRPGRAILCRMDLSKIDLSRKDLRLADLRWTTLSNANLRNADLWMADLRGAILTNARLNGAILLAARLDYARLFGTDLDGARLSFANLAGSWFSPVDVPAPGNLGNLLGLSSLTFSTRDESGGVLLRAALQRAGLNQSEREVTFAIERHRTKDLLVSSRPSDQVRAIIRMLFFEMTTGYGLYPERALEAIVALWGLCGIAYSIRLLGYRSTLHNLHRVWPSGSITYVDHEPALRNEQKLEKLTPRFWGAIGYGMYFSMLSTFHFGWRELNVGSWLARLQSREYYLRADGMLRVLSGIQSLASVYLLALWALSEFGRPFQ